MKTKLYKVEEYHDDSGDVLFFHFPSFEEPPEVLFSSPLCGDFQSYEEGYWTHFIDVDMNYIFEQAMGFKDYKVIVETKGEIEATVWASGPQEAHNLVNEEDKTVRLGESGKTHSVHGGVVDDEE